MAITSRKVITGVDYIRTKSPVKFEKFGRFFLRLVLESIEDQEYIVDRLVEAAKRADPIDQIVINEIVRASIKLRREEVQYRFLVEHEFRCKYCNSIHTEQVNLSGGIFRQVCEMCMDKAQDYARDAHGQRTYD